MGKIKLNSITGILSSCVAHILLIFLPIDFAFAETCTRHSVQLTSQLEVDQFNGGSCDTISGALVIGPSDDIIELDELSGIQHIGYYLRVADNAALVDLEGLHGLQTVEMDLVIENNETLTSIGALRGITEVPEMLRIEANPNLESLDGLESLQIVGGSLMIRNNDSLSNLNGLAFVQSVGWDLNVQLNDSLTDCRAIIRLIDNVDDYEPGPGTPAQPDVLDDIYISANLANCESVSQIIDDARGFFSNNFERSK